MSSSTDEVIKRIEKIENVCKELLEELASLKQDIQKPKQESNLLNEIEAQILYYHSVCKTTNRP